MISEKSDKAQALDLALSHIERQFGRGSLMRLGAAGACAEIPVLPTGSLALDAALGVGGIPRGRITEIYGPEASGKTTLALHVIAEAHKAGGIAAFIDAEHALDAVYASCLGVSVRLEVRRTNVLKRGEEVVGNRTRVRIVKNKLAPPFRQAEFDVLYSQGVSRTGELLDLALPQGFREKNGNWFSYNTMQLSQGREQAKAFLQTSSEITTALEL
jgi:RecA/RadA recombinase